jgi:hypothetical protein
LSFKVLRALGCSATPQGDGVLGGEDAPCAHERELSKLRVYVPLEGLREGISLPFLHYAQNQ